MRQYSICTSDPGCVTEAEEEETLSCELAAELTADLAHMCCVHEEAALDQAQALQQGGAAASCTPQRGASLASTASVCSCGAGGGDVPPPSLYEQLGGGVAVKQVVDAFYERVLGAAELAAFFKGVDMSKQRRKFLLFASYALGGPDEYLQLHPEPWPQLHAAHKRLIHEYGERGRGQAARCGGKGWCGGHRGGDSGWKHGCAACAMPADSSLSGESATQAAVLLDAGCSLCG
jgi:hypothetical protein